MKQYTSKLLLFGEHIIIKGAQALAIPFANFSGSWQFASTEITDRQMDLPKFLLYLEALQVKGELHCELDIFSFKRDLADGLYFESNIPLGYGVGSSGALCAAVYDLFGKNKLARTQEHLLELKKIFAQLESYFHGSSSGTDPLVCYVGQPLLLCSKEEIKMVKLAEKNDSYSLFLLDTKMPRKTSPFVSIFLKKSENDYYASRCESELMPDNEDAIEAFLKGNEKVLFEKMHHISYFQFKYFQEMIPDEFRKMWLDGLGGDEYKLKLCGAGGGGFILGISKNIEQTKQTISEYTLIEI